MAATKKTKKLPNEEDLKSYFNIEEKIASGVITAEEIELTKEKYIKEKFMAEIRKLTVHGAYLESYDNGLNYDYYSEINFSLLPKELADRIKKAIKLIKEGDVILNEIRKEYKL
jgi:hypothetical protein